MKIVVLPQSGYVLLLDNSAVYFSFFVLLAVCLGPAGPRCAHQQWYFTVVVFNCLRNCCCRDDALNKRPLEDGPLSSVILLRDSTDATEAGDRSFGVRYCQCGGKKRSSRIADEGTERRVHQVLVRVLVHVL
jgi:hypothetical protein